MNMTQHAAKRSQQRAIPPMLIDLLLQFGTSQPAGTGVSKMYFDKAARQRVKKYAGTLAGILNDHLNVYLVVDAQDRVITTAHITERIRRN
jgi:hypothetical protein